MPWIWTDDLAAHALEAGLAQPEQVRSWVQCPIGVSIGEGEDALDVARRMLGTHDVADVA